MKQITNWDAVEAATENKRIGEGGYIATILNVEDVVNKEYLEVSFDISEGDFKGYYQSLYNNQNFWGGKFYRSYKESALSFFKGFTTAVEKSNPGYQFNFDETTLRGKKIGIVLGLEQYRAKDGSIKERTYVAQTRAIEEIRKGNFKIPQKKMLENATATASTSTQENQTTNFDTFKMDDIQF